MGPAITRQVTEHRAATGLLLVIGVALVLRVVWVLAVPTEPVSDFLWYHQRATELAAGQGYMWGQEPTAFWAPGYPFMLAVAYWLFGPAVVVGKWLNVIWSVAAVYLTYRLGRRLLSPAVGLLAALGVATALTQISYSSVLATEPAFTCLLLLTIVVWLEGSGRIGACVWTGVLIAVLSYIKPYALALPALLVLWEWWRSRSWRAVLRVAAVTGVVMALVIAPWTYRNWRQLHALIPMSTNGGYVLFINNYPGLHFSAGHMLGGPESPLWQYMRVGSHFDEVAVDREGRRLALAYIRQHPATFVKSGLQRILLTLVPGDLVWSLGHRATGQLAWTNQQVSDATPGLELLWACVLAVLVLAGGLVWARGRRRRTTVFAVIALFSSNLFGVALLMTLLWLGQQAWRERSRAALGPVLIGSTLCFFWAIYFVLEGQPRYNFPLFPFWCLGAAQAAWLLTRPEADAAPLPVQQNAGSPAPGSPPL